MSLRPLIDDLFGTREARALWGVGLALSAVLVGLLAILWPREGQYVPPPTLTVTPSPERVIVVEEGGGVVVSGPTLPGVTPTPAATNTPTPTATPDPVLLAAAARLDALIGTEDADPYIHLLLVPTGAPHLTYAYRPDDPVNAASTHKAAILLYAIFRDPEVALLGWPPDMSGMIIYSNNGDTARVLVAATPPGQDPLPTFNTFLRDVLLLPDGVGMTDWNYGPTSGQLATVPGYDPAPEVDGNPVTMAALAQVYRLLETPADLEAAASRAYLAHSYGLDAYPTVEAYRAAVTLAADRARQLLAEPYPGNPTPLEEALDRARAAHTNLDLSFYGKEGRLGPGDWLGGHTHMIEGGALTVYDGRSVQDCLIAYSAGSFTPDALLDAAVAYCLAAAAAAPPR